MDHSVALSKFGIFHSRMYTRLITRIETTCYRLGKDDKFQLFVCLSAHDRLLGRIVTDLTKAVAAQQVGTVTPASDSFLLLAQSTHLYLHTCVSPHTPTDGVARIFPLTPILRQGIKLTWALLHLFCGTLFQDALPTELTRLRLTSGSFTLAELLLEICFGK